MSNKYVILELLKLDKLTIKEIADKTNFNEDANKNENAVRTYIHRLLKDGLIKQIGKKERYCLYEAILEDNPIELLKFYNDFFEDNIDYILKNNKMNDFIGHNEKKFDKIDELIN